MPRRPSTRLTVVSRTAPKPTVSRSQGRSGRLASSASDPDATLRPSCTTTMWVARRSTSSKSWVTRTIGAATVRRTSSSSSCRRRRTCRSTAAKGSSSSSTRGSRARARATATRCRSPPDSVAGFRCARSARCTSASRSAARALRSPRGRWPNAATTFSSAVRCGKSVYSWNTNPTARWCGGRLMPFAVSSQASPPTRIRPSPRRVQAGNRPENRRLAAAGRAEDRQHVAGSAGEVDREPDRAVLVRRDLQAPVSHPLSHGGSHADRARW